MLAEERFREIQKYVESHGTVTVQELTDLLNTSESTVRRDLTELHKRGTLIKVHGGATTVGTSVRTRDEELSVRRDRNTEEKHKIAVYAAELIEADDFVYLDRRCGSIGESEPVQFHKRIFWNEWSSPTEGAYHTRQ